MSNLLEKVNDLNNLILQGKSMEAFEKYYHEDVIMQDNEESPTIGKDANREREEEFNGNIIQFYGAEPLNVTAGSNVTMVEWYFKYEHKEWGLRDYKQIAVQTWQGDQIIHERFYYN